MKALFRRSVALAAVIAMASISTASANRLGAFYGSQFVQDDEQTLLNPTHIFNYGSSVSFTAGSNTSINSSRGNVLFNFVDDSGDWGLVHSANYQGDPSRVLFRSWGGDTVNGGPLLGDFVSETGAASTDLYQVFNIDYVAKTAGGAFSFGLGWFNGLDDDGTTEDTANGFALRGAFNNGQLHATAEAVFGSNGSENTTASTNFEGSFFELAGFGEFEIDNNSSFFAAFAFVDGQPNGFTDIDNDTSTWFGVRAGWAEDLASNIIADISVDFLSGSDEYDTGDKDEYSTLTVPSCGATAFHEIFWGLNLNFGARAAWMIDSEDNTVGTTTTETSMRTMDFGYTLGVDKDFGDLNVSLTVDQSNLEYITSALGNDEDHVAAITARYRWGN